MANKKGQLVKGRPTKYKLEYSDQVYKLCLLGATDKEIADFLEVNEDTINKWKKVHRDFSESLKKGKLLADANVGLKLFERATGYSHPEIDIKVAQGKIVKTPIIKHYPPDTTAMIFWLKNRKSDAWRDKQIIETPREGKQMDLSKLSDDELRTLLELQRKAGIE